MDENIYDNVVSMSKKASTNRRNAQLSTGPRTEEGKSRSRRNALKHGILAPALLITEGQGAEDPAEFDELLGGLRQDFAPVGAFEEMLVEKIAVCWWRQRRALRCEAGMIRAGMDRGCFVPDGMKPRPNESVEDILPRATRYKSHLSLPLHEYEHLDLILRYERAINRQLAYAINQLERLQRARKGEHIPAPMSVQVPGDE